MINKQEVSNLGSAILVINQLGLDLRKKIRPGNKPEQTVESRQSASRAYDFANFYSSKHLPGQDNVMQSKIYGAGMALCGGGANCDQYSALVEYFFATVVKPKLINQGLVINHYSRYSDLKAHHSFFAVEIKDPGIKPEEIGKVILVCDPWAIDDVDSKHTVDLKENYYFGHHDQVREECVNSLSSMITYGSINEAYTKLKDFVIKTTEELAQKYPAEYMSVYENSLNKNFTIYSNSESFRLSDVSEKIKKFTDIYQSDVYSFLESEQVSQTTGLVNSVVEDPMEGVVFNLNSTGSYREALNDICDRRPDDDRMEIEPDDTRYGQ